MNVAYKIQSFRKTQFMHKNDVLRLITVINLDQACDTPDNLQFSTV